MNFSIFWTISLFIFLLLGCQTKNIDPYSLEIQELDKRKTEYFPTRYELRYKKPKITLVTKDGPGSQVPAQLESIENHIKSALSFISKIPTIAIGNGIEGKTDLNYLVQAEVSTTSFWQENDKKVYKGEIFITIRQYSLGKEISSKKFIFDSNEPKKFLADLVQFFDLIFSPQAFIVESRGNLQAIKISAGRTSHIKRNMKVYLFKKNSDERDFLYQKNIQPRATGRVILVFEDSAWVQLDQKNKNDLPRLGDRALIPYFEQDF